VALAVSRTLAEPFPLGSTTLYVARTFLPDIHQSDKAACIKANVIIFKDKKWISPPDVGVSSD